MLKVTKKEIREFQVEYGLKRGTTDNSYIIEGAEVALIDVPDENFEEKFLDALRRAVDLWNVKHLIIGHTSPKRVKSLISILQHLDSKGIKLHTVFLINYRVCITSKTCQLPQYVVNIHSGLQLQIHCSNPAAQLLSSTIPEDLVERVTKIRVVRNGDYLDLGKGITVLKITLIT